MADGKPDRMIRLVGVRQNNLKGVTAEFPFRKITVVTGLSGSGKSSLVFDSLYAEGQRRYIESLSTYTRQFLEKMPKPHLERVENIPPAIALEQKNHVINSRSTVGTQTEIVDYLRVLFAKMGRTTCVACGGVVKNIQAQTIFEWAIDWLPGRKALILSPLSPGLDLPEPEAKKKKASAKKAAGKKNAATKKSAPSTTVTALFQTLREQGFHRLFWKRADRDPEMVDLEDTEALPRDLNDEAYRRGELWIIVDRVRLSGEADAETRGRLQDSTEQALSLGRGKVAFYDSATSELKSFDSRFACIDCGREHREPEPHLFSFNSPIGACSRCSGFGYTLELDENLVVPDPSKTLKNGAIDPLSKPSFSDWQSDFFRFAERQGISIGKRYRDLKPAEKKIIWDGLPGDDTFPGIRGCFEDLKKWKYKLHVRVFIRRYQRQNQCPECQGARLNHDALAVRVGELNISQALELPIKDTITWLDGLVLSVNERKIAKDIFHQVDRRLKFLEEVGVGYLTLSRLAKTLSGGEFQRINLATQLGNGLCGTLYVLDEPSIGLHASDTDRLIRVLERLRDQGNTVVIVEHELAVMKKADWLIELGPGAGYRGGEVVDQGIPSKLEANPNSITGKYLSGEAQIKRTRGLRGPARRFLELKGCRENNLQEIDVTIPLERFVVVTGVSGSGKSTLVHKTLYQALERHFNRTVPIEDVGRHDRIYGAEQLAGVVLLDQSPIGRSSRSNPATYLKAWDEVRKIYASQSLSIRRGFTPQHFSFNVDGGRCPVCKGEGEVQLDMHFMAELKLPCEECGGKRFKKNVLEVLYRGRSVHQLLESTIDQAYEMFRDNSVLLRKLGILRDVGLGYLRLGQSATTLSGGESQRLKIAATLDDRSAENLLYIFDEPTTGLHLDDVKRLIEVLQDLVAARHSLVVIEHHMDVIAQADWVIDLGPEGGTGGGKVIGEGSPEDLMHSENSITGRVLRER